MTKILQQHGYNVTSSDIVDRGLEGVIVKDAFDWQSWHGDIVTNPPYKLALPILKHCIDIVSEGHKVAMFLRLLFLDKARKAFFEENPPKVIYVASGRLNCAKNGDFERYPSSAVAYAWFVFEKGYTGDTVIKWIN